MRHPDLHLGSGTQRRREPRRAILGLFCAAVALLALPLGPRASRAADATPTAAPTPIPNATLTREQRLEQRKAELRALVEQRKADLTAQAGATQPAPTPVAAPKATPGPGTLANPGAPHAGTPPAPPGVAVPVVAAPTSGTLGAPRVPNENEPQPPDQPDGPRTATPDMVMMLKPYDQRVSVGQRFSSEVVLHSPSGAKFDSLRVFIAYPRDSVRALKVFDYPLADYLASDAPPLLSDEAGLLTYTADLAQPMPVSGATTVLYVVWEALEEVQSGALLLSRRDADEDQQPAVTFAKRNLLRSSTGAACVNAQVHIASALDAGNGSKRRQIGFWQKVAPPEGPAADAPPTNLRLEIRPPETAPKAGDRFVLDVFVDNPLFAPFDEVRLAIGFDPKKAEVLDWDYNNWVRTGINVFDGHAHEMFPFNIHTRDDADNRTGRITYQMGNTKAAPRPSGCLVRIHAKALAAGAVDSFTLWPQGQNADWSTDIRLRGASVIERQKSEDGAAAKDTVATAIKSTQPPKSSE